MSKQELNWNSIAEKVGDCRQVDSHLKKQIEELVARDAKNRLHQSAAHIKTIISVKDGRFLPGYDLLFKRQGGRSGRSPIAHPLIEPPLSCGADYSLIAEQKLNYTVGIPATPTIEKFAENNKPAVANDVINFENHRSINTNPATGQLSLAGITGYGNIPDETIFPGKGLGLYAYMHQSFPIPQNNFAVIQCTARLSKTLGSIGLFDPGPEKSPVEGMVAIFALGRLDAFAFDPAINDYRMKSKLTTLFTSVVKGKDGARYNSELLGSPLIATGGFNNFISPTGMPQSVDITVNMRYQPSAKPIFVNVYVELYGLLMIGNEKISGVVMQCQNSSESTPVLTFTPQRTPYSPSTPFVVEAIRLCGI